MAVFDQIKSNFISLKEFKWAEAFNNSQGKTDIVLVSGFMSVFVGCSSFGSVSILLAIQMLWKLNIDANASASISNVFIMILTQSLALVGVGLGVLTAHKAMKDQPLAQNTKEFTANKDCSDINVTPKQIL